MITLLNGHLFSTDGSIRTLQYIIGSIGDFKIKSLPISSFAYRLLLSSQFVLHSQSTSRHPSEMMEEEEMNNVTDKSQGSSTLDHNFQEPAGMLIARLIIEVALAFMGFIGNAMVAFIISRQRRFRSGLKLFIRNLAFADIGVLTVSFPIAVVKEQFPSHWPLGKAFCLCFYPLAEMFLGVSVWSITAIAIERYRKITATSGVRGCSDSSNKSLKWGLLVIWISSFLVVSLPLLIVMDYEEHSTGTMCLVGWSITMNWIYIISLTIFWYLLPLGIIIFTYVKISHQLQQSNHFHKSSIKRRSPERKLENSMIHSSEEGKRMQQNSKAKKILTPIVVVFAISMLPLNVLRVLQLFWGDIVLHKYFFLIYHVCVIGVVVNSASDPLIYSIVSKDFRKELKAFLYRFAQRLRNLVKIKTADKSLTNGFSHDVHLLHLQEHHTSLAARGETNAETPTTPLVTRI